jgi:cytidine deaminase
MEYDALVKEAITAREMSYAPYSGFMVGAALLGKNGKIYKGCNIESAAYSPTNCAERTAVFKAVSEGEREFIAVAIYGAPAEKVEAMYCYPCGVCRQVMTEFCKPDEFMVIVAKSIDDYRVHTLDEILPHGFGPHSLTMYQK